jgi:hypothetical protein
MVDIKIVTLIDITKTRVIRPNQGSQLELDQNRNFITLLQCAEMRSVISYDKSPTVEEVDIKDLGFGTAYKGIHRVWTFWFKPDREFVYSDSKSNEIGLLIDDLDGVPMIKNLAETINIEKAMFDLKSISTKNTLITAHQGNTN